MTIHQLPDRNSDPIGYLPLDGRDIEVVAETEDSTWGQVNTPERSGWVEMRFLKLTDPVWDRETAPEFLSCVGQGPDWWLQISGSALELSMGAELDHGMTISEITLPSGDARSSRVIRAENPSNSATVSISEGQCALHSGGQIYGLSTNVLLETDAGETLVTGCCSLAR